MTTPGYTDGTESYPEIPGNPNGVNAGWGPPPEAPHFETIDGASVLCIDPPEPVMMTIHRSDETSTTFPYVTGPEFHGAPHACIPEPLPECPAGTFGPITTSYHATWTLGAGEGPTLSHVTDCGTAPPAPAPVPTPEAQPAPTPAPLATPVALVEVPPAGPVLADTGPAAMGATAAIGLALALAGAALVRRTRRPRLAAVRADA